MSEDPYDVFRTELASSLSHAHTLHSSLQRIRALSTGQKSQELREVEDELRGTLAALEADLEELEGSVRVVEETGARRFGISEGELQGRRGYVKEVRKDIDTMRADLSSRLSRPPSYTSQLQAQAQASRPTHPLDPPTPGTEDDQAAWAREEQQMLVQQQDTTLHYISGTLNTLASQAGLIGREVGEHNEMLDDLERGVDRTDNKLGGAMTKLRRFIRQQEQTKSGYCIIFLIIVLCLLLLAVVLL
ncbi:hypothetical protein DACRYDRAFT_51986 [Dacryopinax primogenitus]|uniref:t-SNARE coiled-coil homology domain-containing protein n=1 Tax=Dacryopinax primogenitus (strain DJM 731) TaxID=1858805 RepID=M5G0F6_DACPD|nr:uncharacterized protein DACRYDRAFT_51986 [Dacryopinax primogenitus]EJU02214.1 hypothetical protein DACRYDRAFT_51986 [Dacryopinax primogenitus]